MANDFFEFVYDCILFEYVGFGPVRATAVYLADLVRAFAYIARLYALSPTEFTVHQDVFHRYMGLHSYTHVLEDDRPKIHPLFPAETTIYHGRDPPYLYISALPQGHREKFLWRYARQVPAKYQDDIALLIQKLRRDVWLSNGRKGKGNVKIYRRAHNEAKINRQLGIPKVVKNATPIQVRVGFARVGFMTAQSDGAVSTPESCLRILDDMVLNDHENRMQGINRLMTALQKATFRIPGLQLHITGSYANGLCALTSDVDVTLTGPTQEIDVRQLAQKLPRQSYEKILTIADARVPIVTFWYRQWDISCDISIDQKLSIRNSKLVKTYEAIDPRMQTVWFSLKHLAKSYGILSAKDGFLSSYALTMMLITFLQTRNPPVLPRLQQLLLPPEWVDGTDCSFDTNWRLHVEKAQRNKDTAGDLLVGLLRYFGHQFDYSTMEVNPRLGQFRPQAAAAATGRGNTSRAGVKRGGFWVMDPFLVDRNVAGMCRGPNVQAIKRAFQMAHQTVIENGAHALGVKEV
ncbi:Terminal uridylyltransferase 4 [Mortierella antarctica]|nr:Terminal uridylyltransferase 4 [Mortierella antarctica]